MGAEHPDGKGQLVRHARHVCGPVRPVRDFRVATHTSDERGTIVLYKLREVGCQAPSTLLPARLEACLFQQKRQKYSSMIGRHETNWLICNVCHSADGCRNGWVLSRPQDSKLPIRFRPVAPLSRARHFRHLAVMEVKVNAARLTCRYSMKKVTSAQRAGACLAAAQCLGPRTHRPLHPTSPSDTSRLICRRCTPTAFCLGREKKLCSKVWAFSLAI